MKEILKILSDNLALIVGIGTSLIALYGWVAKPIRNLIAKDKAQEESIASMEWYILQQSHDNYIKKGWCTPAEKESLILMHRQYRAKGRNHLSESYERDILALPEHPPEAA